jgi:hypothetical protein
VLNQSLGLSPENKKYGWLSGTDNRREGTWGWDDGLAPPMTFSIGPNAASTSGTDVAYVNWAANEPAAGALAETQDCMVMSQNSGEWFVRGCKEAYPFVCEQVYFPYESVATMTETNKEQFTPPTYAGAEQSCKARGMTLPVIHSRAQNDAVQSVSAVMTNRSWLGGTKLSPDGAVKPYWTWNDDLPFSHSPLVAVTSSSGTPMYVNWNTAAIVGERNACVQMRADGTWDASVCTGGSSFGCEKPSLAHFHLHAEATTCSCTAAPGISSMAIMDSCSLLTLPDVCTNDPTCQWGPSTSMKCLAEATGCRCMGRESALSLANGASGRFATYQAAVTACRGTRSDGTISRRLVSIKSKQNAARALSSLRVRAPLRRAHMLIYSCAHGRFAWSCQVGRRTTLCSSSSMDAMRGLAGASAARTALSPEYGCGRWRRTQARHPCIPNLFLRAC